MLQKLLRCYSNLVIKSKLVQRLKAKSLLLNFASKILNEF